TSHRAALHPESSRGSTCAASCAPASLARSKPTAAVPRDGVLFRAEGGEHVVQINDWRRLRCCSCGGHCYPDEVRTARGYPTVGWDDDDRPRRGRPPKWLVDARKARATTRE